MSMYKYRSLFDCLHAYLRFFEDGVSFTCSCVLTLQDEDMQGWVKLSMTLFLLTPLKVC